MNILEETKYIMKKYGIRANRSLGQNFLVSEKALKSIVNKSELNKDDLIIEIGPGLGTLTKSLLEKAGKVVCIELDKRMVGILNERFALYNNLEIKNEDILKVNLKKIISEEKLKGKIKNAKIVANLPYYITTPIIMKLLEEKLDIESITVMVQKEVGERLITIPGTNNTGAITYTVYYYSNPEKIMEVSPKSFIPEPAVTSEIIKLKIREKYAVKVNDEKLFFKVIKTAFMQRRKTLINSLVNGKIFNDKLEAESILKELNIDLKIRAEKLSIEDFKNICNKISK